MKKLLICITACLGFYTITAYGQPAQIPAVIFETDMGNDIDDALALDLLYKAADDRLINLLAVSCHKESATTCDFIDLMNVWYGHPEVIVARAPRCITSNSKDFTKAVCEADRERRAYARSGKAPEDAVKMYRRLLAVQPDQSVIIISVGFSTTLADLLETTADEFSPLTGRELVASKVKLTSIMAGNFGSKPIKEFNIRCDIPAAQKLFDQWPAPIVLSPFELGRRVRYPATSIENDFNWAQPHPLIEAYCSYLKMPYNRPMWDPSSVLYAIDPASDLFTRSEEGYITVDENGFSWFLPKTGGRDRILSIDNRQADRMQKRFIELITRRPANRK